MIVCRDVRKSYQNGASKTEVLRGVSLTVSAGEFVYLVGPSGSGKSTLLSILGCVLSPDSGDVEILGQGTRKMGAARLTAFRRENIGFVFQKFHLFPGLTAAENARVPLDVRGVPKSDAHLEAEELLCAVGLEHKVNSSIDRLSMGQRQRVAVARALAGSPQIIFADEPTASLDADSGRATVDLLKGLAKDRGATVLVVTHDSRIFSFADRVLELEDGYLQPTPTPQRPPALAPGLPSELSTVTTRGISP